MPGNNSKYTQEFRKETARHVIESGMSATRMAEEIGIDKITVCSRSFSLKNKLHISYIYTFSLLTGFIHISYTD